MANRFAVILAAGQGTRMKSKLYKVLHPVAGKPMVKHVLDQLEAINVKERVTVVGFGAEKVTEQIGDASQFVIQAEQLGTGHAVQQAEDLLKDKDGVTIVVCGDTPLITSNTYQALFDYHEQAKAKATILTASALNPTGYGRVIRNEDNQVERIVEHKDANEAELQINEINTGTYCFDNQTLFKALKQISNDNSQGEYYLPDIIEILKNESEKVIAYLTPNFEETLGVNDRVALAQAEKLMKLRINEFHMRNGVTILDPDNTYIGSDVKIGQDTIIHPGVIIRGDTLIEEDVEIYPDSEITNCVISESAVIKKSVLIDSRIGSHSEVGPFAYVRPETEVKEHVKIGQFVEVKKSIIGENSKIPHLSYIGDSEIGKNVNVGCGTITVNFDSKEKHETKIADDVFIGCNSNLVAPLEIGKGSFIAAGSTITSNVPEDTLSIARAKQENKEGYASRIRRR